MLATVLASLAAAALAAAPAPAAPRTFRVDYFHTGNATEERFGLDRLVLEPLAWPGRPDRPIDDTNLGKYQVEVRELATHRVVYSRGFASVYGEWPPLVNVSRKPGEWQSLDIVFEAPRFAGRVMPGYFTVFWNGVVVHNRTELFGTIQEGDPCSC